MLRLTKQPIAIFAVLLIILLIRPPLHAQDAVNRTPLKSASGFKFDGDWRASLEALASQDDGANQQSQTTLRLRASLNLTASDWLSFNVTPVFRSQTGFIQSTTAAESTGSSFDLKNASADLHSNYFKLSAGSLNQRAQHSPLILSDRAFPAVRLSLSTHDEQPFQLGLRAQSAIPSSTALTTQSQESESQPSLSSSALFMAYYSPSLQMMMSAGLVRYNHLPVSVSTKSGYLGNTGISINNTDSLFEYDFSISEIRFDLNWQMQNALIYKLESSMAKNDQAPDGLGQGYWIKNKLHYQLNQDWTVIPGYEYFRIEPNTTVAYYNDESLNTNRTGHWGSLGLLWRDLIKLTIKAGARVAIYEKPSQTDEQNYAISLETLDVKF